MGENIWPEESKEGNKIQNETRRAVGRFFFSFFESYFVVFCPFKEHELKASWLRPLSDIAIKEMDYKRAENAGSGGSVQMPVVGKGIGKRRRCMLDLSSLVQRLCSSFPPQAHGWKQWNSLTELGQLPFISSMLRGILESNHLCSVIGW